jgi:glycosyltransferase involved in cell wall biosynthesis
MASSPVQASVIIPALNAAEHIEQQLLALARQRTDVSWELIIADNGSTDGTLAIVRRIASQCSVPVRLVDAAERNGAAGARNAGVAAAAGEFLLFADADDVVDEVWVEEMVRVLREHPFVGGKLEVLELNGEQVASWRPNMFEHDLPEEGGCPWVPGSNFGCTSVAHATIGGFDESIAIGEDTDLSLTMHAHGMTAVFAERAIVHYRYRQQPRQALRQLWTYGRHREALYARHGVESPTCLDALVVGYRVAKLTLRDLLRGRRPVTPALDLAFILGEASFLWRNPAFWQPVCRREALANPLRVQRERLVRLARRHQRKM